MKLRQLLAALTLSFAFALPAQAGQQSGAFLVGPLERPESRASRAPSFEMTQGDLRQAGVPRRSGLIAAFPLRNNLDIGVGRFSVPEIARPRTHVEADRQPSAVRSRDRGIAAVGVSLRFR